MFDAFGIFLCINAFLFDFCLCEKFRFNVFIIIYIIYLFIIYWNTHTDFMQICSEEVQLILYTEYSVHPDIALSLPHWTSHPDVNFWF